MTTKQSKQTKKIPRLRFPEFQHDGEWEEKNIASIGSVVTGNTPSKEDSNLWGNDFVWATAQDFKKKYIFDSTQKLSQKGKSKCRVIPKNSVLVTCIASIGLNGINKVECSTNQQINSIICNSNYHYEFVYYSISHSQNRLRETAGQTAVPIISKSAFEKFQISIPPLPEQQKIASCLSSLDEVIEAHTHKLEQLKLHKKGLMQGLFPQQGEKVPRLRFPEFQNNGDWEERKLGEIGETINGLSGKSGKDFGNGELYVTYKQVFDSSVVDLNKCSKVEIHSNENQNTLKMGDILITTSSETPHEVGFASVILDPLQQDVYLNSFCFALRPFDINTFQPHFARYLFHSPLYRNLVSLIAQGSTRFNLSKRTFIDLKLLLPQLQEQQKIASCLSSLDEVIEAHTQKLEQLKLHKKGLMQGLFPQSTI